MSEEIEEMYVIEAALFSAGRPLSEEEISEATEIGIKKVRSGIKALIKKFKEREGSLEVAQVGKRFAMQLRREYAEHVMKLAQVEVPIKLIKTVALIAYHQPIKQSELHDMIGDKVYEHVRELRELGMVRTREFERTRLLSTTEKFVEYFGLDVTDPSAIKYWLAKQVGLDPDKEGEKIEDWMEKGEEVASVEEPEIKPREIDTSLLDKVQRVISDGRAGNIEEPVEEELETKFREIDTSLLSKVEDVITEGRKGLGVKDEEEVEGEGPGSPEEQAEEDAETPEDQAQDSEEPPEDQEELPEGEEEAQEEPQGEEIESEAEQGPKGEDQPPVDEAPQDTTSAVMKSKMGLAARMGADKMKKLGKGKTEAADTAKESPEDQEEEVLEGEDEPEDEVEGDQEDEQTGEDEPEEGEGEEEKPPEEEDEPVGKKGKKKRKKDKKKRKRKKTKGKRSK